MAYRWDPFGELASWRDAMDRMWRTPYRTEQIGMAPPIDVSEDADNYQVRMALPGIKPEDVQIQLEQNVLTVNGEMRPEETQPNRRYLHQEHQYGNFSRTISLPTMVDTEHATAQFEHGMLTITLPKHAQARARRIPIEGRSGTSGASGRTIEASSHTPGQPTAQAGTAAQPTAQSTDFQAQGEKEPSESAKAAPGR